MFGRGFEEYLHLQNTAIIELMKSLCFYSATAVQLRQNSITCTRHKLLGSTSCQFVCVWKSDTLHLLVSNHVSYVACIFIVVNAIFRQQCVFQQGRRWEVQLLRMFSRLVLWNILVVPYIGNNHPNWYFSEGLKPPTSQCVGAPGGGSSISQRHVWGNGSQMRVSGYPKRMVYEGKSYKNGWFGGTPISGNPQIWLKKYDWMIVVLGSWPYSISNPPLCYWDWLGRLWPVRESPHGRVPDAGEPPGHRWRLRSRFWAWRIIKKDPSLLRIIGYQWWLFWERVWVDSGLAMVKWFLFASSFNKPGKASKQFREKPPVPWLPRVGGTISIHKRFSHDLHHILWELFGLWPLLETFYWRNYLPSTSRWCGFQWRTCCSFD